MNNNIIAIIAISFIIVGSLWGIGNLISQDDTQFSKNEGIVMLMKDNKFNVTNPDIAVKINQPLKVSIANQDFRKHDFIVDELNINTGFISSGQDFTTLIASDKAGSYRYYCSIHPGIMEGKIMVTN
ncbi:MAG TPA: cupredoxin domain-containing protein [Nitrososphaeraceae archaeon]|nr:cupredoxin domain-containing protein [Nitrososphaeraceae archaeon]